MMIKFDSIWLNLTKYLFQTGWNHLVVHKSVQNEKAKVSWQLTVGLPTVMLTGKTARRLKTLRICRIKHQPCHVIYTDKRPVPLQHYLFPAGGDGVYMVVDEKGQFREDNFHKALTALQSAADSTNVDTKKMLKRKGKANLGDLEKIVRMCNSA